MVEFEQRGQELQAILARIRGKKAKMLNCSI